MSSQAVGMHPLSPQPLDLNITLRTILAAEKRNYNELISNLNDINSYNDSIKKQIQLAISLMTQVSKAADILIEFEKRVIAALNIRVTQKQVNDAAGYCYECNENNASIQGWDSNIV